MPTELLERDTRQSCLYTDRLMPMPHPLSQIHGYETPYSIAFADYAYCPRIRDHHLQSYAYFL